MFRLKSIQQRLTLFLLLPVFLLLIGMGVAGYSYARNSLFNQWREAAILKLQRAAHNVDMKLSRIIEWVNMFHQARQSSNHQLKHEWIIAQLEKLEGVARVNLILEHESTDVRMQSGKRTPNSATLLELADNPTLMPSN